MTPDIRKIILSLSAAGLIAIASHEAYSPKPYVDLAGIWTNGFGNTHNVIPNKGVTVPQALDQLNTNSLEAQAAVTNCITKPLTQSQFDAFVDFTFNVGSNAFCKSTVVKKFNAGDIAGSCGELKRWVYAGGKVQPGLVKRRDDEYKLCMEGL